MPLQPAREVHEPQKSPKNIIIYLPDTYLDSASTRFHNPSRSPTQYSTSSPTLILLTSFPTKMISALLRVDATQAQERGTFGLTRPKNANHILAIIYGRNYNIVASQGWSIEDMDKIVPRLSRCHEAESLSLTLWWAVNWWAGSPYISTGRGVTDPLTGAVFSMTWYI
jgi:hypothetical protein